MCGIQEVSRSSERFYILIIVKILLMAIIEQYVIDKIVNITYFDNHNHQEAALQRHQYFS